MAGVPEADAEVAAPAAAGLAGVEDELMGVPNLSTPSLAADMIADPSSDASKRLVDAVEDVPRFPRPRPCETDVEEEAGIV